VNAFASSSVDDLEPAALSSAHWFDEKRLHFSIGYRTPVEAEEPVKKGGGFFNGGTTYGNVYVSDKLPGDISASIMTHENIHATQWAMSGGQVGFPLLYAGASGFSWLQTGTYGCGNFFEWQAGHSDGGYGC
jgi:hypothetical protein